MGYSTIIFDCQGQITTPMTYFAVEAADKVLIPVKRMSEISFSLLNVKRLVQGFKFDLAKFIILASSKDIEIIQEISVISNDEGRIIGRLDVKVENCQEIIKTLFTRKSSEDLINKKRKLRLGITNFLARNKTQDIEKIKGAPDEITSGRTSIGRIVL
jgi:cellulose biosynthesis protein BcsQ